MSVMDAMMAFPAILFAVAIMAALGPKTFNVVIALGATILDQARIELQDDRPLQE